MTKVLPKEWWYIINKTFYYGPEAINSKLIQLIVTKWEGMRYWTKRNHIVDFPWEYDINGEGIRCWESKGKLSFVVRTGTTSLALLSNSEVLELWAFDDVDEFYCVDQSVMEEIEKMELEGEIKLFDAVEEVAK